MNEDFHSLLAIDAGNPYDLERSSKAILNHYVETAKDRFLTEGKLIPVAIFRSEERELVFHCGPMMNSEEDKDKLAAVLRQIARQREAVGFFFTAEAWMASYEKDTPEDSRVRPVERPDRMECLITSAQYKGERSVMRILQIVRNHKGDVMHLLEKDDLRQDDDMTYEGRFAGILNETEASWENTNFWR